VAEPYQVDGTVHEPELVRINLSDGLLVPVEAVVTHLYGLVINARLIELLDGLPEAAEILLRPEVHSEALPEAVHVVLGLPGKARAYLFEERIDGLVKNRALQYLEHVRAQVQRHELRRSEWVGKFRLKAFHKPVPNRAVYALRVDGKAGVLQRVHIPVDSANAAVLLPGQTPDGDPVGVHLEASNDPPLTGKLISTHGMT